MAKVSRNLFEVRVLENRALLPSEIREAIPEGYAYRKASYLLRGNVAKDDGAYVLTAQGSGLKIELTSSKDVEKLVSEGRTLVEVSGEVTEPEDEDEMDDRKPLPVLAVRTVKECKKEDEKKK